MGVESTISIPIPTGVFKMVDDTDPAVSYNGPWSQDFGTTDSIGNAGSTYNHTTHVIKNNGSLSFTFTGTEFTAAASMTIRDVDAQNDPDWTCSIDGFPLSTGGNNGIDDTNRYILCSNDSLALGQHTVSIGVRSLGTPFWFDYIRYMPGPTVSNDSSVLIYDSLNGNIQYDGTFLNSPIFGGAHMTQTNGGALSVPFNGTSISWIGYALPTLPEGSAQAKYSVDLGPDVQFSIPTSIHFQETYFTTSPVQNGPHTLVVTFEGNKQTTPLMLDYFLVSTGPAIPDNTLGSSNASVVVGSGATPPGTSTSTGPELGPAASGAQHNGTGSGTDPQTKVVTNIGAIVGCIVGGVAFTLLAVFAIYFIRKRRRQQHNDGNEGVYHSVAQAETRGRILSAGGRVAVSIHHVEPWSLSESSRNEQTQGGRNVGSSGPSMRLFRKGNRGAPPGYSP